MNRSWNICNDMAFPMTVPEDKNWHVQDGLTKRELFAALAMHAELYAGYERAEWPTPMAGDLAKRSVQFADALIKELEETKK